MVQYLVKDPSSLVRYLASNLLNRGYYFYSHSWLPEGIDVGLIDAKLLMKFDSHLTKEKQYRLRKAGRSTVRYLRCGRLCLFLATRGKSAFFEKEAWKDARSESLNLYGYSLRVNRDTQKVSIRIHPEAERRIKKEMIEKAGMDARWWERRIFNVEFIAFKGVQDGMYHLVTKHLNPARKLLRKPPIEWKRCIRRYIKPAPVFADTPKEIADLVKYMTMR